MAALKFTDPEVDKRFEALTDKDRMVEMPGTYAGLFSKIPRVVAARMLRQESNLLKAKDGVKNEDLDEKKADALPASSVKATVAATPADKIPDPVK